MKFKKILVWFRNDLRLHDNEMLVEAIAKSDCILPVYFFDPRYFEQTKYGTDRSGAIKTRFLLESVAALRTSFQRLGGDLLVLHGRPEDHLPRLVEQYELSEVYHHREVAAKETQISAHVEDRLWKLKINLKHFIGHTLYNKEDLPFPIKDIPNIFSQFKKKTERDAIVKACFLAPEHISFVENTTWGTIPTMEELGLRQTDLIDGAEQAFGGEEEGLKHLDILLREGSAVYSKGIKATADKPGFTSQLSAWLSVGCLSPRKVYWQVKMAEGQYGTNANFNHLILGLLWRDYFRFMFKKHGQGFVKEAEENESGLPETKECGQALQHWKDGITGNVLIDNYMKQLNASGFIPHAGRLLVATFLIYTLKINWTFGAAYFEEKLIDYSPASNWGNWAIVAEGGKEPRSKNAFDLEKQFKLLNIQPSSAVA